MLPAYLLLKAEMFQLRMLRPGAIVILIAVVMFSHLGMCSARSLKLNDDFLTSVNKRNSWWSKKSVAQGPDYPNLGQESPYTEDIIEQYPDRNRESIQTYSLVFSCYVKDCVPRFVRCVQASATTPQRSDCKRRHETCALVCGALAHPAALQ